MKYPIAKVYMIEIEAKDLISISSAIGNCSVEDSQNLIVDIKELKTSFCEIE